MDDQTGYRPLSINDGSEKEISSKCSCKCCNVLKTLMMSIWRIISFILSYTIIWSIISEILLLINVYPNDHIFFGLSLTFLIIPLMFVSFMFCIMAGDFDAIPSVSRWLLFVPFINIPIGMSSTKLRKENDFYLSSTLLIFESLLTGTMTFPLYIINLSYLLETVESYQNIEIYNILQLSFSILLFIKTPISYFMGVTEILLWEKRVSVIKSQHISPSYLLLVPSCYWR
eukprot:477294_1